MPSPRGDALQRATAYIAVAGGGGELGPPQAIHMQMTPPPTARGNTWDVVWPRQFQGLRYRDQELTMILNGQTGAIRVFGRRFASAPPPPTVEKISREQAIQTAAAQMVKAGFQPDDPDPYLVQHEVVQPNTFWTPGGSELQKLPGSRIAWTCAWHVGSKVYEGWVDAETGAVIGGSNSSRQHTP